MAGDCHYCSKQHLVAKADCNATCTPAFALAVDSQTEKLFVDRLSQSLTLGQTLVIATHRPALFAIWRQRFADKTHLPAIDARQRRNRRPAGTIKRRKERD